MNRFGVEMVELLQKLDDVAPEAVDELCRMQREGSLTRAEIDTARLAVIQRANQ